MIEQGSYYSSSEFGDRQKISVYEHIADVAESLIGRPSMRYRGSEQGMDPQEWFDCSGFVTYVLRESGIVLPDIRHCNEYFDNAGYAVHYPRHQRGDLIFFSYNGGVSPTHMGIITSPTTYVHAPGKDNTSVTVATIEKKPILDPAPNHNYVENYIGIKRIAEKVGRWQQPIVRQIFPAIP